MKNGALILLLAILVGIGGWYVFNHSQPNVTINTSGDKQIKENTEYYTISVTYPANTRLATRTDSSTAADTRAVSTIEQEMGNIVQQFKNNANQALTQDEKDRLKAASTTYALDVTYNAYNSGSFTSYEFDIYEYTGGAHPNNAFKTFVFDLQGNPVALGDLFTGVSYLNRISTEAKKQITEKLKAEGDSGAENTLIDDGVAPRIDNFSNWVDSDGMLIFFIPPYQAAAYAAGSFEVHIPLTDFKDILKKGIQ